MVFAKASLVSLSLLSLVAARPSRVVRRTSGYGSPVQQDGWEGYVPPIAAAEPQALAAPMVEPPAYTPPAYEPPVYAPLGVLDITETVTATETALAASATYGSGYAPWNNAGYDNCVQQCLAQYPPPPTLAPPPPPVALGSGEGEYPSVGSGEGQYPSVGSGEGEYPAVGSGEGQYPSVGSGEGENVELAPSAGGAGRVWEVIVAPAQGVLRFMPFAVMGAAVGDTVRFRWKGAPHTVTKASALSPCNATLDAPFASGRQEAGFVFDQVVNDTNPVWFYCAVGDHCVRGMFGVINPAAGTVSEFTATNTNFTTPTPAANATTVAQMIQSMSATSTDFASKANYVNSQCANSTVAANWGSNMLLTDVPVDQQEAYLENVLYTRLAMAQNPELVEGSNLNIPASATFKIPADINALSAMNAPESTSTLSGLPGSITGASGATSQYGTSGATRVGISSGIAIASIVLAALL